LLGEDHKLKPIRYFFGAGYSMTVCFNLKN